MKQFFALLMIVLLAASGYHLSFRSLKVPLFARRFYLTGTEFLFIGMFLGPHFLNVLDIQTCDGLAPLSVFALGWVGLLFGFQFEVKKLQRYPLELFFAAIIESVVTFAVVFGVSYMVISFYFGLLPINAIISALVISGIAACTSQTGLALATSDIAGHHKNIMQLLRFMSSMDGLIAIFILGVVFMLRPLVTTETFSIVSQGTSLGAVLVLCIGLLFLFGVFLSGRMGENEMVLVVIAMVVITSGAASMLNFSPLLANAFLGICLVNLARNKEQIFNMLVGIEKPIYLLVLIFLGVTWELDSGWLFVLAGGYGILRAIGKVGGGYAIRYLGKELSAMPRLLGFGLLSPGGLAMAILLDFYQGFSETFIPTILSVVLLGIVFTDIISPHLLRPIVRSQTLKIVCEGCF